MISSWDLSHSRPQYEDKRDRTCFPDDVLLLDSGPCAALQDCWVVQTQYAGKKQGWTEVGQSRCDLWISPRLLFRTCSAALLPTHPSYLLSIPSLVVPQRSFWISPRRFSLNSGSWAELAVHLWWAHSNLCWCCVHSQHAIIADVESPAHRAKHSTVYPSLNKEKRLCMFTWWYIVTFLYAS